MVSIIKVLKSYEKKNISLKSFFITLSSVIIVRFFLEKLLEPGHSFKVGNDFYANFIDFSHIYISWLVIFFSFIIISIIVLKINIRKSIKYILLVSPVILIVPLIDFFTIDSMRKISYNFNNTIGINGSASLGYFSFVRKYYINMVDWSNEPTIHKTLYDKESHPSLGGVLDAGLIINLGPVSIMPNFYTMVTSSKNGAFFNYTGLNAKLGFKF